MTLLMDERISEVSARKFSGNLGIIGNKSLIFGVDGYLYEGNSHSKYTTCSYCLQFARILLDI